MRQILIVSVCLWLLSGCGGGGTSIAHVTLTAPNGLNFNVIDIDFSYEDLLLVDDTHLYAIHVHPGYEYQVTLYSVSGDSDLYLYYDYSLSPQSLLAYSEREAGFTDNSSFYADFDGTVYIEVYGATRSQYIIDVSRTRP